LRMEGYGDGEGDDYDAVFDTRPLQHGFIRKWRRIDAHNHRRLSPTTIYIL
jgi:hypothetical protein